LRVPEQAEQAEQAERAAVKAHPRRRDRPPARAEEGPSAQGRDQAPRRGGRKALAHRKARLSRKALLPVGAGTGLLSALAGFAGPLVAPFFLATGLVRGAYIGTEAAAALTVHAVKLPVYGIGGAVTPQAIFAGAVLAPALIAGAWIGKRIVDRVSASLFTLLVEGALVVAAVRMIALAM